MEEIYLDNAATTRTYEEVARLAVTMMCQEYGNPSSLHEKGFHAGQAKEKARDQVAHALGCSPSEVTFTSGGTEANNLAIIGAAKALARQGKKIITTKTEHASVGETFRYLESEGFEIHEILPLPNGDLDIAELEVMVDEQTILVSCGMVNSEIGSVTPIQEVVKRVKKKNPNLIFHTDGVQAFGKLPFSANRLGVDLLTVSGHKIGAPKGVGALYIKKGVRIRPLLHGGGQENGLRPGTEATPAICGFGLAAETTVRGLNDNFAKVRGLCKYFVNKVEKTAGLSMNSTGNGTPYICNISVPGYRSETILHYLADHSIYVSSGSACAKGHKSHVLSAMGLSNQRIDSALRISFSPTNTTEEIDRFFAVLHQAREDLIRS